MSAMLREPALLKQLKEQAETHAIELRAYEATVANLNERIRQLEATLPALADGPKNGVMLEPDDIRFIMEQSSIGEAYTDDEACGIVLWIGETIDEDIDAAKVVTYGLNFYNVECPEEGSICIKELTRPAVQQQKEGE